MADDARLAELERESAARTAELYAIAAELPRALGRRAFVRTLLQDVRSSLDLGALASRTRWDLVRSGRSAWRSITRCARSSR
jgi:hypothetical protein